MRIQGVDLPEALLVALQEDRLVVFAGAGVSQGHPSNLPNFRGLADRIAAGTAQTRRAGEPDEVFLGRLQQQGVRVHARAAGVVLDPTSAPTELHCDLLRLFRQPEHIRLVTTNFDGHFEAASLLLFNQTPVVYRAPALPLGDDFLGLVYVHGSAMRDERSLVLTDGDFGRAYLTQGWARRFLLGLFSKFVVLFVGYSHNDTVLKYLARGLPPASSAQRYALIRGGDDLEYWHFLGVEPLTYPPDEHGQHGRLQLAVHRWAEIAARGTLDTENYIRDLATAIPSLNEDDQSFLERAIRDLVTVRFFTRHARSREWLHWLDSTQVLDPLFSQGATTDRDREFAGWIADCFVVDGVEDVLALIERHQQWLHPDLWARILGALIQPQRVVPADVLSRWVPVLLSNLPRQPSHFGLEELLLSCVRAEAYTAAAELLAYLTSPRTALKRRIPWPGHGDRRQTDIEIIFPADFHLLREHWPQVCQPHLGTLAQPFIPALVRSLESAHRLLEAWGKADRAWDPLSYSRSAIEPHGQDRYPGSFDFVVNTLRDALDWIVTYEPMTARNWIGVWADADAPIVRRLAIHGFRLHGGITANEKLEWIIRKEWLRSYGLKHEVFLLLRDAYSQADHDVRATLLEHALARTAPDMAEERERNTVEYEKYNLLVWLTRAAPDCELAQGALERLMAAHPEFQPREYPDLDHWSEGGWVGYQSPLTVDGLLARPAGEHLDFLLSYRERSFEGPDRRGLLEQVTEACKRVFAWSHALAGHLIDRGAWGCDLWPYIVRAWAASTLDESQWEMVLTLLNKGELLAEQSASVADLLEGAVTDETTNPLPPALFGLADALAVVGWTSLPRQPVAGQTDDWLSAAISDSAGRLTLFWLHALSRTRTIGGDHQHSLVEPYRQRFTMIVTDETQAGELGRVLLASQLGFLFSIDEQWTRESVLSLFDWDRDRRRARQAWAGFLVWGRWSETLLAELVPHYLRLFACHPSDLTLTEWQRVAHHVAGIALYGLADPLHEWLPRFLQSTRIEQRVDFASHVWYLLHHMRPETKAHVWPRWLKQYWQQRNQGVPIPWDRRELEHMAEWVIELEPCFEEAVNVFTEGPAPVVAHTLIFHRFGETRIPEEHADALARYALHFLAAQEALSFHHCNQMSQLMRRIIVTGASRQTLAAVCEQLGRLGCRDAGELRTSIAGE